MMLSGFCQMLMLIFLSAITLLAVFGEDSCIKTKRTCAHYPGEDKYVRVKDYICDTQTDGGGWIVFQSRLKKDTNFKRNWTDYENGFGDPKLCQDYWLGNRKLHKLTSKQNYELRIDMTFRGQSYWAKCQTFRVASEEDQYRLTVIGYSGNVKDQISFQNDMKFSTPDRDNDNKSTQHCAQVYGSGWWFNRCHASNPNGQFGSKNWAAGVIWTSLTTEHASLDSVEMKIRKSAPN